MNEATESKAVTSPRLGKQPGALARAIAEASAEVIGVGGVKQALIYLRVSSRGQVETDYDSEGFSLPAQRAACIRKASALGAEIVGEFVEKAESGTSTKRRKALAALLERVAEGGIDYVIVHKVDRLARSRDDDSDISRAIRGSGAVLVSVSENIDESPSGMLLHGIMASIAEFYSRNLASETLKGTTEKAKRGGTPGKAPIGYLNVREMVEGREIRTVAIDPERAPLIKLAFELYVTGKYSLSELATILAARGLRSRATPRKPSKELGTNDLATVLRNDYYIGVVRYAGVVSEGRHQKLVDDETFQAVQDLLTAKRQSGERPWRHHHYLRGTIHCGQCGGRLVYTRANGRGGTYEYFVCMGRGKGICNQPHHRVEAVERAVESEYARIQLTRIQIERIREGIKAYVAGVESDSAPQRSDLDAVLRRLAAEEKKLLRAHYDDRISETVFDEEQERIRRERIAAERHLRELELDHRAVLANLEIALEMAANVQQAYSRADANGRRLFNQAIFRRIWIENEHIDQSELESPFREIAEVVLGIEGNAIEQETRQRSNRKENRDVRTSGGPLKARTPDSFSFVGGSNVASMVARPGLEPGTPRFSEILSEGVVRRKCLLIGGFR
jgi:site-specific DNA recombinase